jgi:hypothetical protein
VKKGWHAEQTSTFISLAVEIVSKELPQAQVTLIRLVFGWIFSFMTVFSVFIINP